MTALNKILLALGITVLIALLVTGAYFLWLSPSKNSNNSNSTKTNSLSSKDDPNGPYYHQIYSATSKDGLTWTKNDTLLFDHASVPGAVIKNGKIYLYFVDPTGDEDQLSLATSEDNGKTFSEKKEVKIKDVNKWDSVDPNPIPVPVLSNNKIRLYYFGNFKTVSQENSSAVPTIYSAESEDGINFDNVKEVYKSINKQIITDPDIIETPSDWRILVSIGKGMELGISKDQGLNFTKDSNFSWTKGGVSNTVNFDGKYRTYYCGLGGIISATGIETGKLTEETGVRISSPDGKMACDPSVVKLPDGSYLMFYKTQASPQQGTQGSSTVPNQNSSQQVPGQTPSQAPSQTQPPSQ